MHSNRAMQAFYRSSLCDGLCDPETGLYLESPSYLYELFCRKWKNNALSKFMHASAPDQNDMLALDDIKSAPVAHLRGENARNPFAGRIFGQMCSCAQGREQRCDPQTCDFTRRSNYAARQRAIAYAIAWMFMQKGHDDVPLSHVSCH